MTINVALCNLALQAVGTRSTIASAAEGSVESNNASLVYDRVRQHLLRSAQWNFARATATLSLLKASPGTPENASASSSVWSNAYPPPGWLYSYAYPSDCLAARKVLGNYGFQTALTFPLYPVAASAVVPQWDLPGARFEVGTDLDAIGNSISVILTNAQAAILCYTRDIVQDSVWDPSFSVAFVSALAGKLALALTGDKALAKLLFEEANRIIVQARVADGNEGPTISDHTPDWITAGYGTRWLPGGLSGAGYAAPWGPLFVL